MYDSEDNFNTLWQPIGVDGIGHELTIRLSPGLYMKLVLPLMLFAWFSVLQMTLVLDHATKRLSGSWFTTLILGSSWIVL